MGSLRMVILGPGRDEIAGMIQSEEQTLVQQLIAHAAIERLDIAVLHRLARGSAMPVDPVLGAPGQNGMRGEFGTVIGHYHSRLATALDQHCQFPGNPLA